MHYILYVYQSVYIIYVCCVCERMRGRECVCVMWACVWVCFHPVNTFKYACVFPYPFVSYVNTASTNTRLDTLIIFSNNLQQILFFFIPTPLSTDTPYASVINTKSCRIPSVIWLFHLPGNQFLKCPRQSISNLIFAFSRLFALVLSLFKGISTFKWL